MNTYTAEIFEREPHVLESMLELAEHYIERRIYTPSAKKLYRTSSKRFDQLVGLVPPLKVTEGHALVWRKRISIEVSPVSANTYRRHLVALFRYGYRKGLSADNPFIDVPPFPTGQLTPITLSNDVVKRSISAIRSGCLSPPWFWELVLTALLKTGMRVRQLVELEWRDIDFSKRTIHYRVQGSKTYREWTIPLPDEIFDPLWQLYKMVERMGVVDIRTEQVFNVTKWAQRYAGTRMTVSQVSGAFGRLRKQTGINVIPRRARHTAATKLANTPGVSPFTVQKILGHTDVRTTQIYVATDLDAMRDAMTRRAGKKR